MVKDAPDLVVDVPAPAGDAPHPWMDAYVLVTDHPYFTVTAPGGSFRLDNVPAGQYTVEAWHPNLGKKTARVTVRPGRATEVHFPAFAPSDYRPPSEP